MSPHFLLVLIINLKKDVFEFDLFFPGSENAFPGFSNYPLVCVFVEKAPSLENVNQVKPALKSLFESQPIHLAKHVQLEVPVFLLLLVLDAPKLYDVFHADVTEMVFHCHYHAVLCFLLLEELCESLENFFLQGPFIDLRAFMQAGGKIYPLKEELLLLLFKEVLLHSKDVGPVYLVGFSYLGPLRKH